MNYRLCTSVKERDDLRASFNELTQITFGFDFKNWYANGHWGEEYIPHVLVTEDNRVVSNVSMNLMHFCHEGHLRNYIQIGTVMTHPDFRGLGLNARILKSILTEYIAKVDGIYLFGNDSVLDYYPKFGFKPIKEYEYSMMIPVTLPDNYQIQKVDMSQMREREALCHAMNLPGQKCSFLKNQPLQWDASIPCSKSVLRDGSMLSEDSTLCQELVPCEEATLCDLNVAFRMVQNSNLLHFWLEAGYDDQVYYLPQKETYVIASVEDNCLLLHDIFGSQKIDMKTLVFSLKNHFTESGKEKRPMIQQAKLLFTPVDQEEFYVKLHKEEDCTLFILGEDLLRVEQSKMMFPELSHA